MPVQFDIFIPSLDAAIEYHGPHQYQEMPAFGSVELYQQRDQEKQRICQQLGIVLVIVPFSWNQSTSKLIEIITDTSPRLLEDHQKEQEKE